MRLICSSTAPFASQYSQYPTRTARLKTIINRFLNGIPFAVTQKFLRSLPLCPLKFLTAATQHFRFIVHRTRSNIAPSVFESHSTLNKKRTLDECSFFIGAGGGTRTHTPSLTTDFESVSSASSNTPAFQLRNTL